MKKFFKGLIIVLLICATVYCAACYVLWNRISEFPKTKPAILLTDHSLKYDETFELPLENISVSIPTYYSCMDVKEFSSYLCESHVKNKSLLVMYRPANELIDKVTPGFSDKYNAMMKELESFSYPFPISLTHENPETMYDVMKEIYVIDRDDYNMWNLADSYYVYYCLKVRAEAEAQEEMSISYLYERDNICAFIGEDPTSPGTYAIMISPTSFRGDIYAMIIQTGDIDDITRLLNTYEFK